MSRRLFRRKGVEQNDEGQSAHRRFSFERPGIIAAVPARD